MNRLTGSVFACMALSGAVGTALAQNEVMGPITVTLSGEQEVPGATTAATGQFTIQFDPGLTQATYTLSISGLGSMPVGAHLHCGPAGVAGSVVVPLATPTEQGVQDTISNDDITAPSDDSCGMDINNIASLVAAIREDLIYVNVHSETYPEGELRGQLLVRHDTSTGMGGDGTGSTTPGGTTPGGTTPGGTTPPGATGS